ncbi:MAG: AsmA family protein [Candidatus Korobacteraceae bacterium]
MPGRISRRAWWVLIAIAVIVLGLLVPPFVNVNRYRNRVAASIGQALDRDVTVSSIELRLLPRPAMVLSTFVVGDDPTYGAEPMLRADTVTAYLRLSSLWRGRLEIGTLSLENPSLNLVRRADGHWNLEELVERTSQVPSAPTTKARPESRPRFPYVEATAGRINFKLGRVKKAFAFADADFALWLQSENEWGVRLEAHPVRSDVPVSDTGTLRVEGSFQRASQLRSTPVSLKINFAKGQLGQVTTLIYGRDRGWRGGLSSTAALAGTPASLAVTLDAQIDDFRRYDIALGEALRLSAHCTGTYSSPDDSIRDIQCQAPVRPGLFMVRGDVVGWAGESYNLGISAEQIPLDRVVALARHTKKDLPADLTATGTADGIFTVRKDATSSPQWAGGGRTSHFALQAAVLKQDLQLGEVEFSIPQAAGQSKGKHTLRKSIPTADNAGATPPLRVVVSPFAMPLGAPSPATAAGYFDLEHYQISLSGNAELTRLLNVARATGIGTPKLGLAGSAQLDLQIAGTFTGFAPPLPSGRLQLSNATGELQGVLEPLKVTSATVTFADQSVNVSPFTAEFNAGPVVTGSASFPLICTSPETCVLRFDLHAPEVSLAGLNQLFDPALQSQPWYHLLAIGQRDDNALLKVVAIGHLSAARALIGTLPASNLSCTIEMDAGTVSLKDIRADVLGGHHTGNWDGDFTAKPPKFFGSGSVSKVAMAQVATLMHDAWATGTLDGQYTLSVSGLDATTLRDSATGTANFKWSGGTLRHIVLEGKAAPLSFSSLTGEIAIRNGALNCDDCKLQSGADVYQVKGNASFARNLDLQLRRPDEPSYAITGPLDKPRVEAVPTPSSEAKLH